MPFEQIQDAFAQRIDEVTVGVLDDGFSLLGITFSQEPQSVGVAFYSFRHVDDE